MATIKNFEELEVWKLAMELCTEVYNLTNAELFSKDFGLKDQLMRSSLSISSNIAEGFGRSYEREFIRYLRIAIGSLYETQSQLVFANKVGAIEIDLNDLFMKTKKIRKMIFSLISHLEKKIN
jgi:four helix bundle protein